MAVFYDTGGGDIYAGPTKEAVIAAMKADSSEIDEQEIFEVSGKTKMAATDENECPTGESVTLEDEYTEGLGAYCICTENS